MPQLSTIKGLDKAGRLFVERIFEHYSRELITAEFHPSVVGAWYLIYNPVTQAPEVVDGSTTVSQLQQMLNVTEYNA